MRVAVTLQPGDFSVASLDFKALYHEAFAAGIGLNACVPGTSATAAGAQLSCVRTEPPGEAVAAVLNKPAVPVLALPAGDVVDFEFSLPPRIADLPHSYSVCIDPPSVHFGSPAGPDVCAGPPVCGSIDIAGCRQGDCNCDGAVNAGDLVCLVTKFFDRTQQGTCDCEDCNGSGELNAADAPCVTLCAFGQCPTVNK